MILAIIKIIIAYVLFPAISYLLGSLSFGLIVGRLKGVDIRKEGSGNVGATNVWRVLGKGPGAVVFALDVLKGAVPALVFALIARAIAGVPSWKMLGIVYGAFAIFGHVYPLFFEFRGGKAVATSCGVFMVLAPLQTFTALMIWLTVLLLGKYVSVASMAAALSFLLMVLILYPSRPIERRGVLSRMQASLYPAPAVADARVPQGKTRDEYEQTLMGRDKLLMLLLSLMAAGVVFYRHRANIKRLREGTEPKIMTSKADLKAAEAEKKYGKERLARAGSRKPVNREALRAMSKPKKPDQPEGEKPTDEKPTDEKSSDEKSSDEKPAAPGASADAAKPAGEESAAADKPADGTDADQVETEAPLGELEEIPTDELEEDDQDKKDTDTKGLPQ